MGEKESIKPERNRDREKRRDPNGMFFGGREERKERKEDEGGESRDATTHCIIGDASALVGTTMGLGCPGVAGKETTISFPLPPQRVSCALLIFLLYMGK